MPRRRGSSRSGRGAPAPWQSAGREPPAWRPSSASRARSRATSARPRRAGGDDARGRPARPAARRRSGPRVDRAPWRRLRPGRPPSPNGRRYWLRGPVDEDAVLAVDLLELDLHDLFPGRRHVLADMVGADGELPVATVDEDGETDRLRPAEVDERVHRGPDRPAGVENVVDEDDRRAVQIEGQVRALHDRLLRNERQVVAVERDVEGADGDRRRLVLADRGRDP